MSLDYLENITAKDRSVLGILGVLGLMLLTMLFYPFLKVIYRDRIW